MGIVETLVTVGGLVALIGLLVLLFCHHVGGWTRAKAWLRSSGEEKMILTRAGTHRHFNPNGYMISSDSDLNLSGRGSFRRFDTTDTDYEFLRQGSISSLTRQGPQGNIPPQPLRPAPIPPSIASAASQGGQLTSQSSLDSVFNTAPSSPATLAFGPLPPRIPPPPQQTGSTSSSHASSARSIVTTMGDNGRGGSHGRGSSSSGIQSTGMVESGDGGSVSNLSSTNPFLPLLQASSQFFSQTIQSFQSGLQQTTDGGVTVEEGTHHSEGTNHHKPDVLVEISSSRQEVDSSQHNVGSSSTSTTVSMHDQSSSLLSRSAASSTSTNLPATGGLSMGELLFSAPPVYQSKDLEPRATGHSASTTAGGSATASQENVGSNSASTFGSESTAGPPSGYVPKYPTPMSPGRTIGGGRSASVSSSTSGSPQHTRYMLYHQNSAENVLGMMGGRGGEGQGFHGVAPPNPSSHSPPPGTIPGSRRASYPNRKEYTPHDTIPKSEFPQHIPYIPSPHHHHHHHHHPKASGAGGGNTGGGIGGLDRKGVGEPSLGFLPDPLRHLHFVSPPAAATPVPPFVEEQEEPPEEPQSQMGTTLNSTTGSHSVLDSEREDLKNRIMLETMREEIRIANERMADVTKSLMMDDVFLPATTTTSTHQSHDSTSKSHNDTMATGWTSDEAAPIKERIIGGVSCGEDTRISGSALSQSTEDGGNNTAIPPNHINLPTVTSEPSQLPASPSPSICVKGTIAETTSGSHSHATSNVWSVRHNGLMRTTSLETSGQRYLPRMAINGGASLTSVVSTSNPPDNQQNVSSVNTSTATTTFSPLSQQSNETCTPSNSSWSSAPPSAQGGVVDNCNVVSSNAISTTTISARGVMVGSYLKQNSRSFSLRQSSTDSIGSDSDLSSPTDGGPALQRAMSCDSVCSDTSVILGDLDPPHVTGYLCIGLEYDSETADLLVNVMEAKELVGLDPDPHIPFDSYVRVYLLPDKTTNMQTRVYRKSLCPVYKEKFMFGLEMNELASRSLVFYLYATDKYTNTLIGEAELKLGDMDFTQPVLTWLLLTDTGQRGGEFGEIMFSLSYLPTAERLTVVVVKGRNLKFPHERETGDPFVKVYLLQRGKKVSKKKSSTKRGEKNPIFNEAMIFSIPAHVLQTIQLRITVADSLEAEGRAYSIGHVIVGSAATGKPLSHWNQMLSSLRKPIAMWHALRK